MFPYRKWVVKSRPTSDLQNREICSVRYWLHDQCVFASLNDRHEKQFTVHEIWRFERIIENCFRLATAYFYQYILWACFPILLLIVWVTHNNTDYAKIVWEPVLSRKFLLI